MKLSIAMFLVAGVIIPILLVAANRMSPNHRLQKVLEEWGTAIGRHFGD